jgi:hypothetical protein
LSFYAIKKARLFTGGLYNFKIVFGLRLFPVPYGGVSKHRYHKEHHHRISKPPGSLLGCAWQEKCLPYEAAQKHNRYNPYKNGNKPERDITQTRKKAFFKRSSERVLYFFHIQILAMY